MSGEVPVGGPDTLDPRQVGARIERALDRLRATAAPDAAECAEQLVELLVAFYGAGLARIVRSCDDETLRRLAADDLVASLLVVHDLHPDDTPTRVRAALEEVRPYLGSHAGGVTLLGIAGGVVRLRLDGSCDGCPSSSVTVRTAIERAIERAAPEVTVEVEGLTEAGTAARSGPQFIELLPACPAVTE